jgi:hypothetical protein
MEKPRNTYRILLGKLRKLLEKYSLEKPTRLKGNVKNNFMEVNCGNGRWLTVAQDWV